MSSMEDLDLQTIQHVLNDILDQEMISKERVKSWMDFKGITEMYHLIHMFEVDEDSVKDPYYLVNREEFNLQIYESLSLGILCLYARSWELRKRALMTNQDWLTTTKSDFDSLQKEITT